MTPIFEYYPSSSGNTAVSLDPRMAVKAEFSRLIHAAIINRRFREKLITNPIQTIETGYCGEAFYFSRELRDQIRLIHADSLEDFSFQFLQIVDSSTIRESVSIQYQ